MAKKVNKYNYLTLFIEKFGIKFSYDKFVYSGNSIKSTVSCHKHGDFEITPYNHAILGVQCKKCSYEENAKKQELTLETFIIKANKKHNLFYNYESFNYNGSNKKSIIICPNHGEFLQTPGNHLSGQGCPSCGREKTISSTLKTEEIFISKAKEIHGNIYNYDLVEYSNTTTKVKIVCPTHGEFLQTPQKHLHGQGCSKCGLKKRTKTQTMTIEDFTDRSSNIHNNKFDYSNILYKNSHEKIEIICPEHGNFTIKPYSHLQGKGCGKCVGRVSKMEIELMDFIKTITKETIIQSENNILNGKEIDLYLPDSLMGFEFNGLYWHSDEYRIKTYHIDKWKECEKKGVNLFSIWEDDWVEKQDIVKSIIKNKFNKNSKIYARKCYIKEIDNNISKEFLIENHIQGNVNAKIKIGLFYEDLLVSVMTFSNNRKFMSQNYGADEYELLRFSCLKEVTVVGGFTKLLNFFEKNYKPKKIITFASLDYFNGNSYEKNGFKYNYITQPNFWWTKGNKKINRYKYTKYKLVKMGFDPNKTGEEIMNEMGYKKLYGCGNKKYTKILEKYI